MYLKIKNSVASANKCSAVEAKPISTNAVNPKNHKSRKNSYIYNLLAALLAVCLFAGCSKDEPKQNNQTTVPDPEGTITANIARYTRINIGNSYIHWNEPDNFYLESDYDSRVSICNLGAMAGLGNITKIPTSGFTQEASYNGAVACEAGHGYVIRFGNFSAYRYVRLYVVEPIVNTLGGIIGAKVKYQYPFEPTTE